MVKLFTHTDLDGVGCAVLAKIAFDSNVDIEYCNYDEINNKVNDFIYTELELEDICHITDISITDEIAKDIDENSNQFYLLDHHPTALDLNKYNWCTVKIEDEYTKLKTCGTEMYYKWLVNGGYLKDNSQLREFVSVVRDYDTWRWTTIGENGIICKKINDLLYLYGRERFIDWCISRISDKQFPLLTSSDKLLLEIKQKEIDDYIDKKDKTIFTTTLCGYTCGFVFAERFFSELGNKLCLRHPELDFVAMIDMDGTVSYRSVKDNVDVGKDIAKIYGGGGHPKAAGSQFSNDVKLKTLENIFV
jgi:oligoribonuclease NrnB/cAMP/cGMP phosphodiesterase (DHH superfamily)